MFTVTEAAHAIGRDPSTIRRWIRSGRLSAERERGRQLICGDDLEAVAAVSAHPPAGGQRAALAALRDSARWTGDLELSRRGRTFDRLASCTPLRVLG